MINETPLYISLSEKAWVVETGGNRATYYRLRADYAKGVVREYNPNYHEKGEYRTAESDRKLGELVSKNYKVLLGFAVKLTKNKESAHDLVHDSLIETYRLSARIVAMEKPIQYLCVTMRNNYVHAQKQAKVVQSYASLVGRKK